MNLPLCSIEADFVPEHADLFRHDLHPYLHSDCVLGSCNTLD